MKQYSIVILFLIVPLVAMFAEEGKNSREGNVYQGFSGGMMLHFGALVGKNASSPYNMEGGTYGIGGAARVNLWKYWRVGAEGYVSTMPSGITTMHSVLKEGSYVRNGWGGIVSDFCYRGKKVWPFLGFSMGGGAERSLYLTEGSQNDWNSEVGTVFHKQGYFYVAPYIGTDVALTNHVHITVKADWVLAIHKVELLKPTGPRLYVGIMFCR